MHLLGSYEIDDGASHTMTYRCDDAVKQFDYPPALTPELYAWDAYLPNVP